MTIKRVLIATGSPQANGQVERINRIIAPMLAKLSDDKSGKQWYKVLENVEYLLNNTVNQSINCSSSRLLFGIDQRGNAVDEIKDFMENNFQETDRNFENLREIASRNIERAQVYNKNYVDKKRKKAHNYTEGDFLMLGNFENTPGVSKKLIPRFKGPYRIIQKLRNDIYVVADVEGFQNSQRSYQGVWEPANMRPWIMNE